MEKYCFCLLRSSASTSIGITTSLAKLSAVSKSGYGVASRLFGVKVIRLPSSRTKPLKVLINRGGVGFLITGSLVDFLPALRYSDRSLNIIAFRFGEDNECASWLAGMIGVIPLILILNQEAFGFAVGREFLCATQMSDP